MIEVKATPEVVAMAKNAIAIQDAANPIPVINALHAATKHFVLEYGTSFGLNNPISRILLSKVNQFCMPWDSWCQTSFELTKSLSEGKDITVS